MTSFRQIEANRRNALKSTGPTSAEGKERSRRNAIRHGLTAETVISALEDADDYKAFETAITTDYDAQSAVERELVLRLASLLWRLRRAGTIETGLFELQAKQLRECVESDQSRSSFWRVLSAQRENSAAEVDRTLESRAATSGRMEIDPGRDLTTCFLRLADLPNYALDRLSQYEASLSRQLARVLLALNALNRRRPHERSRSHWFGPQHGRFAQDEL